jgi:hypothetical protein
MDGLGAFGAVGDLFQAAEGVVDGVGVGEGVHEVGGDEDYVGAFLNAGVVLAADFLAEVEGGAFGERIEFRRLLQLSDLDSEKLQDKLKATIYRDNYLSPSIMRSIRLRAPSESCDSAREASSALRSFSFLRRSRSAERASFSARVDASTFF